MTYGVTTRNCVDHMYTQNRRIDEGTRRSAEEPKECSTQFKTTIIVSGIIGGGIGSAIPPYGMWTLPGIAIGVGIGIKIAEACEND